MPSSWKNPSPIPTIKGAVCITNTCHETSERLTTAAEPAVPGQLPTGPAGEDSTNAPMPGPQPPPGQTHPSDPGPDPQTTQEKPACYPSSRSGMRVHQGGARSTPRTAEATWCHPTPFASPWTTSEETTVLWISSISDRARAETTRAQRRCDDHRQDTAHEAKWSLRGQLMDSLPAQLEGCEGQGRVVGTDSKTSRILGRVAWKAPGRGPTEHPTKISGLTQRSCTHTHTHTPLTQRSCTHTHTQTLVSS